MTVTLVFLAVMMALFGGWLFSHSFGARPWEALPAGSADARQDRLPPSATASRVGLAVLLAVVTSLFALTISAYLMRMEMSHDWRPLPTPGLLWWNTAALAMGSLALQWAWVAARRGQAEALRRGLILGGLCTLGFVFGQALVWRQLQQAGYYMASNPANAFFFLLTTLHVLHLLGGLVAWARTLLRARRGATPGELRAAVELCALYWHYLLAVWIVLFALVLST